MIKIIKRTGDIPEVINLHATMETSHTSEEIILESPEEEEIILESPEEVLLKTEVISQDMNRDKDLEINTSPMDLRTTMVVLLHSEVMAGEEIHLLIEKVEETSTATATGLTVTEEENPVALDTDTLMVTEVTDRALDLSEEGQENIKDRITDSHQLEVSRLNSVEDQHQEKVEMETANAGDVEIKVTSLRNAKCFPTGGANPVIVACFTEEETATLTMEHL